MELLFSKISKNKRALKVLKDCLSVKIRIWNYLVFRLWATRWQKVQRKCHRDAINHRFQFLKAKVRFVSLVI